MVNRIWIHVALGLAVLGLSAGCGGGPRLIKVQGVVTMDDKPLSWASITFVPTGEGRPATGLSDESGSFQLTTSSTNDGAAPGEYKVTVLKQETGEAAPKFDPSKPAGMAAMFEKKTPEGRKANAARLRAGALLPSIYADPQKTPLREVVPPAGPVRLELNSKAK